MLLGLILESCSLLSSFLQVLGGKSMSIMFVYACTLFLGWVQKIEWQRAFISRVSDQSLFDSGDIFTKFYRVVKVGFSFYPYHRLTLMKYPPLAYVWAKSESTDETSTNFKKDLVLHTILRKLQVNKRSHFPGKIGVRSCISKTRIYW